MTRQLVPFSTPDVSAFTKTLKNFLDERHVAGKLPPSHVELLNLLARAAGMRNFAALKASSQTTTLSVQELSRWSSRTQFGMCLPQYELREVKDT
jgi:pyrroloquinoline quinone (PQQ) biosynthesis protein C